MVAFVVKNRTQRTVTLVGSPAVRLARSIARVAVQFNLVPDLDSRLANVPDTNWSRRASAPLAVPSGSDAWVQSSLLMSHCSLLGPRPSLTVNRSITLDYREGRRRGAETISLRDARITLRRGPAHPTIPVNGE